MPHWPGDPEVRIESLIQQGCHLTMMSMCVHTGTHMDAPLHFLENGIAIDRMPLDATVGPARVIAIRNPAAILLEELEEHNIRPGERILFKTQTRWSDTAFLEQFVSIAPDAARLLAKRLPRCVGIDSLSVGALGEEGVETHRILLQANIWIIEGLDLSQVEPGPYELICLPLRIPGADGAPARAVLHR